ncbi:MAG TPA: hypothetical protein VIX91_19930 [Candidatus Acidoferrum sp.]
MPCGPENSARPRYSPSVPRVPGGLGAPSGPPAIDREFKTIDFLTLIDLQHIPDRVRIRLF